jgi:hypothetical protein
VRRVRGEVDRAGARVDEEHRCHDAPPSVERKTPRSSFFPNMWPRAATSRTSVFRGSIQILPMCS